MWKKPTYFVLGTLAAPIIGAVLRPLIREVIKGGIVATGHIKRMAAEVREDLQDITAEASAELDKNKS